MADEKEFSLEEPALRAPVKRKPGRKTKKVKAVVAAPEPEEKFLVGSPEPVELLEATAKPTPKELFPMPASNIPPPEPENQEVPDWASETPGSPEFPVMTAKGWSGGGLLKFSLCEHCTRYNKAADLCEGPAPESWRSSAKACINYNPKEMISL